MFFAAVVSALVLVHGVVTMNGHPVKHAAIVFTQHSKEAIADTDSRGRYTVHVSPGTWSVRIGLCTRATPFRVSVSGAVATRNFRC
jgi:hypothetical protein